MGFAIDEEKLNDPKLKVMDVAKPPLKSIPYQPFPKAVYLHPKDKSKEHKSKLVKDQDELDAAEKAGWKQKPHIPEVKPEVESFGDEYEVAEAEPQSRAKGKGKE